MQWIPCLALTLFGVTLTSASFLDVLHAVHNSPVYHTLSHADQLMIVELLSEGNVGELKMYIDDVGFQNVLAMIDRLPATEAHNLTQYLIQELNNEQHGHTLVGRSIVEVLQAAMHDPAYQHLATADQELVKQVLSAAESSTLTHYIKMVGYAEILRLVDILPQPEKHLFEQYLYQHLQTEATIMG